MYEQELAELNSLVSQVQQMIVSALEAVADDGRVSAGEAFQLGQQGFSIAITVITNVARSGDKGRRDRIKHVALNSRLTLPE